jgi:pimeloyl-ACP methyl ester carboxylesterase
MLSFWNNHEKIYDLEIVECQKARHYPMLECPVFFASKLEEFCK